jgi:hypothetical protein
VRIPDLGRGISEKALSWEEASFQRSWKNSGLRKGNILENSCLRTGTQTDSNGSCENSGAGEREYPGKLKAS